MMKIAHRINVLTHEIAQDVFSKCDGIEFDIRDSDGHLIVQHDAFKTGQLFSEFLEYCPANKFYIVNVKAEGVEELAIQMLEAAGIQNFFLLDCGIPAIMKLKKRGERRIAIRFSEVEPVEMVTALQGCATWVWVDCFQKYPLTAEIAERFQQQGLKICLVSPDLQGRPDDIEPYVKELQDKHILFDAVCAKLWNHSKWTLSS
jgi:hypothetical protein